MEVEEVGTEEPVVTVTSSLASAADQQAAMSEMESGYTDTPTDIPTEPAASPESATDTPSPASAEPVYAKITEDEYKRFLTNAETVEKIASTLEQRFGTAFGHIGGIQQKLKEMQDATPRGQAIKLTKEDFAEMQADFPEFADMQMKGLERALSRMSGTGAGLDSAKAEELVDTRIVRLETKLLKGALTDLHEDWETVVGAKDSQTPYRQWLATQPQEYQDRIAASRRPSEIAKSITKFKEVAATPPPKPKVPAVNEVAEARRAQLNAAVTPKGAGGAKVGRTELDDLQEAFDNA